MQPESDAETREETKAFTRRLPCLTCSHQTNRRVLSQDHWRPTESTNVSATVVPLLRLHVCHCLLDCRGPGLGFRRVLHCKCLLELMCVGLPAAFGLAWRAEVGVFVLGFSCLVCLSKFLADTSVRGVAYMSVCVCVCVCVCLHSLLRLCMCARWSCLCVGAGG